MKNLITMSNLTFTKKKCNCGLTSIKSKTKKHKISQKYVKIKKQNIINYIKNKYYISSITIL